jgi:hypothetical protein
MVSFNDNFHLYMLHASEWKGDHEWRSGRNVWRGVLATNLRTAHDEDHNNPRSERPFLDRDLKKQSGQRAEAKPLYFAMNRDL